jgi:tetratricopeptide (TPR) repeat protein
MKLWLQAIATCQNAASLAEQAHRTDLQAKALALLAFSEMRDGSVDDAARDAAEAVRLGENCGNKAFYFDALDAAGEVETKRDNLAAANDYLNRALAISEQVGDKFQLYNRYVDRGEVYYEDALGCNYKQGYDVCYRFLQLSQDNYMKAQAIAQARGYTFLAETVGSFLQHVDVRRVMTQRAPSNNQKFAAMPTFNPKQPKDVLATEYFTFGGADPGTFSLIDGAVRETEEWRMRMLQRGLDVPDLNAAHLYLQGSLAKLKGDLNTALAEYLQAVQLVEQDRRKLRDEQARSAFMEDKLDYYYSPALSLLQQKRYAEAFALFEQSRSRATADNIGKFTVERRQCRQGCRPIRDRNRRCSFRTASVVETCIGLISSSELTGKEKLTSRY